MDKQFKRTLVTCALPYANGPIHIGHLAGVYVPADIYVRYLRMRGRETQTFTSGLYSILFYITCGMQSQFHS